MRSLALAIVALLVAACGGAAQPAPTTAPTAAPTTAPTPAPTPVSKLTLNADLKSENEVPPIANEEKSASGKAIVTLDLTRDATGKITGGKASFDITLTGFPATAAVTIAHIHIAPAGQNGGVKVGIKTDAANPVPLTAGAGSIKATDVTVDAETAQALFDNPAGYYVNVHSRANAGGVVRGQLTKA